MVFCIICLCTRPRHVVLCIKEITKVRSNEAMPQPKKTSKKRSGSKKKSPSTKLIRPEAKAVDVLFSLALVNTTVGSGHTGLLNLVVPGTGPSNRIGRKISMSHVHFECVLSANPAAITNSDTIVCILYLDRDISTALPGLDDLMRSTLSTGLEATSVISPQNLNTTKRFKILRRKVIHYNASAAGAPLAPTNFSDNLAHWEWSVPMSEVVLFNATNGGTIADIENNGLLFGAWGSNNAVAQAQLNCSSRVSYFDA
ncbi:MAG: capsid protein [Circoviridae sp.]|nr:MAG: capsid protein [Circoviridae sp.]